MYGIFSLVVCVCFFFSLSIRKCQLKVESSVKQYMEIFVQCVKCANSNTFFNRFTSCLMICWVQAFGIWRWRKGSKITKIDDNKAFRDIGKRNELRLQFSRTEKQKESVKELSEKKNNRKITSKLSNSKSETIYEGCFMALHYSLLGRRCLNAPF